MAETDAIVTVPELVNHMNGIELRADQQQAAERIIRGLQGQLERVLHRPITVREFTRVARVDRDTGIFWTHTPLISVASVTYDGDVLDPSAYDVSVEALGFRSAWGYPYDMSVVYSAGLDGRSDEYADLRMLVMDAAARGMTHRHDNTISVRGLEARVQDTERRVDPNTILFSKEELEPHLYLRRPIAY